VSRGCPHPYGTALYVTFEAGLQILLVLFELLGALAYDVLYIGVRAYIDGT
jgi:hypothetical protein